MLATTHRSQSSRAFTLIELLVVIAIIGILSSVVLASLNTARARANDAKRYSDLRQIMIALELYYSTNGQYPSHASNTQVDSSLNSVLAPTYIPTVPTDPQHTGSSGYRYCSNNTSYTLLAFAQRTSNWCSVSSNITGSGPCSWAASYPRCGQ